MQRNITALFFATIFRQKARKICQNSFALLLNNTVLQGLTLGHSNRYLLNYLQLYLTVCAVTSQVDFSVFVILYIIRLFYFVQRDLCLCIQPY